MSESSRGRPTEIGRNRRLTIRVPHEKHEKIEEAVENGAAPDKSKFVRDAIDDKLQEVDDV